MTSSSAPLVASPDASPLRVVILSDPATAVDALLRRLSPAERQLANRRYGTARRHFVLGRLAAHAAVRNALGAGFRHAFVEVVPDPTGRPRVCVNGAAGVVQVSISHVSRLAAVCAWRSATSYRAGVDLERVRPTGIAGSSYAFSVRERRILSRVSEGSRLAGLAAWAVKEAVWKALWPSQPPSPASVEIRRLSLCAGRAILDSDSIKMCRRGDADVRARLRMVRGPDGPYVLAVAEIGSGSFDDGDLDVTFRQPPRSAGPATNLSFPL